MSDAAGDAHRASRAVVATSGTSGPSGTGGTSGPNGPTTLPAVPSADSLCIRCASPLSPSGARGVPHAVPVVEPARRLAWYECGRCGAWTRVPFASIESAIADRDTSTPPPDETAIARIPLGGGGEAFRIGSHVSLADRLRFRFGTRVAVARRPEAAPVRILAAVRVTAYVASMASVVAVLLWPATRPVSVALVGACYAIGRVLGSLDAPLRRRIAQARLGGTGSDTRGLAGDPDLRLDARGVIVHAPVRALRGTAERSSNPPRTSWLRGAPELLDVRDDAARALLPVLPTDWAFDRDLEAGLERLLAAARAEVGDAFAPDADAAEVLGSIVRSPAHLHAIARRLAGGNAVAESVALERLEREPAVVLRALLTGAADGWIPGSAEEPVPARHARTPQPSSLPHTGDSPDSRTGSG